MHDQAFKNWRQECETIEQEMDRLIRAPVPTSAGERQVRRIQFTAIVERREDAARKLIQADRDRLRNSWRKDRSALSGEYFISAAHVSSTSDAGSHGFVKLPDGRGTAGAAEASPNSSAIGGSAAEFGDVPLSALPAQAISTSSALDSQGGSTPVVPTPDSIEGDAMPSRPPALEQSSEDAQSDAVSFHPMIDHSAAATAKEEPPIQSGGSAASDTSSINPSGEQVALAPHPPAGPTQEEVPSPGRT